MTHDSTDPHGDGTMGSTPSQGVFIGYLALGLLGLMVVVTAFVFIAAATQGFS